MTNEEELKFMGMLIQMGFGREYILWAMYHVSEGHGFGWSMMKAVYDTTTNREFPKEEE